MDVFDNDHTVMSVYSICLICKIQKQIECSLPAFPHCFISPENKRCIKILDFYDQIMQGIEDCESVDNFCAQLFYNLRNRRKFKLNQLHMILGTSLSLCLKFHSTKEAYKNITKRLGDTSCALMEKELYILNMFHFDPPIKVPKKIQIKSWSELLKKKKYVYMDMDIMTQEMHKETLIHLYDSYKTNCQCIDLPNITYSNFFTFYTR